MRWIEATRNFDQKKKKSVYGVFFFFNPDEIWKKKSLIFFPPSRYLQRVGTRSRFAASRPLFAHWGCRLLLQGPLALVMSGPIRMKMEDKKFRLQLFFLFQIFFIVESMMGWFGAQLRFSFSFFFLYLAVWKLDKSSLTLVKYHLHHPASLYLFWWPGLWFRLTSHPFSPSRSSRTHLRQDWRGNCCCCC